MSRSWHTHVCKQLPLTILLVLLFSACAESGDPTENMRTDDTERSEADTTALAENHTPRSPETIPVMIYCIDESNGYRVFPDPIIARPGDSIIFHVHGMNATVILERFKDYIDNSTNSARRLASYTGGTSEAPPFPPNASGQQGQQGKYRIKGAPTGANPPSKYEVDDDGTCGDYIRPPERVGNPSMIIEN